VTRAVADRVFVLGAGRAGRGLARALRASGVEVVGVHGRRPSDGVSAGPIPAAAAGATVVLVTVRDAQLEAALGELLGAALPPETVVLHASGSAEPSGLEALRARGHPAGTFHPLVPLADPARAAELLRDAWVGLDGDAAAQAVGRRLAERLGARSLVVPRGEKPRYHAAAVIASNFPAALLAVAERVLRSAGVSADTALSASHSLFWAASENLRHMSGADALTGPVVRGDVETIRAHLDALAGDPEALDVYRALTRVAVGIARHAGTDERQLAQIARLVG
jgi:predicted short-subunit dehydrogenase-like oxidoreductase (DUF2520 family)